MTAAEHPPADSLEVRARLVDAVKLDLVGVGEDGRLVVVELKRATRTNASCLTASGSLDLDRQAHVHVIAYDQRVGAQVPYPVAPHAMAGPMSVDHAPSDTAVDEESEVVVVTADPEVEADVLRSTGFTASGRTIWSVCARSSPVDRTPASRTAATSGERIRMYVGAFARFARHFGRSPARLGPEQVRAYQIHLPNERRLARSTLVVYVSAIGFLYQTTLNKA